MTDVFTPEEVKNLNDFQVRGGMHPFTCGSERHDYPNGPRPMLEATTAGWVCPDKDCDYTQTWAHSFMLDGSATAAHAEMWGDLFGGTHD